MPSNLEHALRYAQLGIPVFPVHFPKGDKCSCGKSDCSNIGKHPITRRGCLDASTDTDRILKWWTANPQANIGAATGGEFYVVDADGPDGMQDFADVTLEHCDSLQAGPVVLTGGGGSHNWFLKSPDTPVQNATKVRGLNIDIRGDGGYVIMPPSLHESGESYREHVGFDTPIPECPQLLAWATSSAPAAGANGSADGHQPVLFDGSGKVGPLRVQPEQLNFTTCSGVAEGGRHHAAAQYAGRQFRRGDGGARVLLDAIEWNRSNPAGPLPHEELCRIVADVEERERGKAGTTAGTEPDESGRLVIPDITSAEFDGMEIENVYLVEDILTKGEPCVIGGFMKTLKTSVGVDLALSLGCGRRFLSRFWSTPSRVGIVSGESGRFTLQETARRICQSKGVEFADADVFWHFVVPCITDPKAQSAVVEWIERRDLDVVVIDPLYLSFVGVETAKFASNVIAMGSMLREFATVVESTGVTLVIIHHTSRTAHRAREFEPADLSDLSMAGLAEFARSWVMLSRRSPYEPGTGEHQLWLNTGGSAGHGGLYGLDVCEGTRKDDGGRRWDIAVLPADEVRETDKQEQASQSEQSGKAQMDAIKQRLLKFLQKHPDGQTLTAIRPHGRCRTSAIPVALEELIDVGKVETCEVTGGNKQKYEGYRIVS